MKDFAELIFRKATIKDYDILAELYYESDILHYGFDSEKNKKPVKGARSRDVIESFISGDQSDVMVAEMNGGVVGFVYCLVRRKEGNNVFNDDVHTYIGDLGVLEAYCGMGIGKALLKQAEEWSLKRNIGRMVLEADCLNKRAIGLYEKVGYRATSVKMEKSIVGGKSV